MPDRYIEKSFLLLLCISLLIHILVFSGLYFYPSTKEEPKEPVFIDLQQMPEIKNKIIDQQKETKRRSEKRVRVEKESAPEGHAAKDFKAPEKQLSPSSIQKPSKVTKSSVTAQNSTTQQSAAPGYSAASLLKPKEQRIQQEPSATKFFPAASRLAKLEEGYRRKFESEIADGDTKFLNSDDIVFGSFLRRFEGAVYGIWRYPQEAALRGIEGITPVRITFNRRGEITNIQQLESSGARILDEEVLRTLRSIGPVGGFPKGYDKQEFHLIAFFQYGGARRSLR